jgi:uncharacterized repeat protein (TIGR01451 family)
MVVIMAVSLAGSAVAAPDTPQTRLGTTAAQPADGTAPIGVKPCLNLDLSTGTTQPFVPDPFGSPDPDWYTTASPDPNLAVPTPAISINPVPSWYTDPNANWVDPWGTGYNKDAAGNYSGFDLGGDYVFATTFTVNGALYNNIMLNVNAYAADNQVQLVLDNVPIGTAAGFGPPNSNAVGTPFSMSVTPGTHTLEAKVNNVSLWMGLLVDAYVTASCKPDMEIKKSAMGDLVAGQPGTYMLSVSNLGMGPAGNIYVNDTLPTGSTFVSATGSGWTCTNSGLNVSCTNPGPVPAMTSLTPILITFIVPQGQVVTNCASVDVQDDADWGNNKTCVDSKVDPGKPSTICGVKFNDINGNGIHDPGEPGMPNWTIQIKDSTGTVIASVTTDNNGRYCFKEVKPGVYTVLEVPKPNWTQTAPATPGTYTLTLNSGVSVNLEFGNKAKKDDTCCLSFRFPFGRIDNFVATNGPEPASPSPGLVQFLNNPTLVGFDYPNVNHMFATTMTLPQGNCVDSATLNIHVRPNGSALNSNDAMALRFVNSSGSPVAGTPAWGAYFGTGNPGTALLANTWDTTSYPLGQWITLNLASLPGGGNFIPALNGLRFLDLWVQDDTSVDAIVLSVKFCQCAGPQPVDQNPKDKPDMPLP